MSHLVKRVDALASFLDVPGNGVGNELVDNILEVSGGNLPGDDVAHLLPDVPDLLGLRVASLLLAEVLLPGEPNAENPQQVAVSGLHIHVGFNESLPLLDHGSQLISGQVHAMKVGQAVLALDLLTHKLELPVGPLGVILVLQVSEGDLVDSALEPIAGNPGSLSPVDQGLANLADLED